MDELNDKIVAIRVAKTNLSRLVARAEAGEEIIITRRGEPVAKLIPVAPKPKRVFGSMRGQFTVGPEFFEPLPPEELDEWLQAPDANRLHGGWGPPVMSAVIKTWLCSVADVVALIDAKSAKVCGKTQVGWACYVAPLLHSGFSSRTLACWGMACSIF